MSPAPVQAVPTPVKMTPEQIKGSHAAKAAAEGHAASEATVDIHALLTTTDRLQRDTAASELVNLVKIEGPAAFVRLGLSDAILKGLADKKNAGAREGACTLITTLCNEGVGASVEPFIFEKLLHSIVSETFADKDKVVREAAVGSIKAVVQTMTPWAAPLILPILLDQIKTAGKWQVKTGALEILDQLVASAPLQIAKAMPTIVPVMAEALWDTKADVKKASKASLTAACALISNKDIEKFIPALIQCLLNPEKVTETIQLLAATTFVSEVDSPTLALIAPLLARGLEERLTATRRKVAVIIDNMTKLVDNEWTVRPFLPKLLPGLLKIKDNVADPEARAVVEKAIATLQQVGKVEGDGSDCPPAIVLTGKDTINNVVAAFKKSAPAKNLSAESPVLQYIAEISASIANLRFFDIGGWQTTLVPYVVLAVPEVDTAKEIVQTILDKTATGGDEEDTEVFADEEEGEDLCNCTFSLAYGAKILLNTATLRLKRGHRYGLLGRNGSGKSTLMTAIINGQVEGFPSPDEVRVFYVAHDIDGSDAETSVLDFIITDQRIQATPEEVKATLTEVGFSDVRQKEAIGALSGGWKMKLALARAILFKADILLLDEPTNHLDVLNVTWLINYLTSLTNCTSIMVSHDADFLNRTVTDVLYLNRFKLKRYPGDLNDFAKRVPEAKAYFELDPTDNYKFRFPEPPLLDGVKTKEKSLLKMRGVGFQYPTSPAPQLYDITLQVSLSSRVAILGPNGSGKSTLVKLLVGETEANKGGEVWKHPNLVIGYVAQHAFHHIDMHLDKTPLEYLLQRYQTGEDLEELNKVTRQVNEEDLKKMKEGGNVVVEGQKRVIDEILNRKKLKQSYEYEVSFKGLSSSENIWMPRDELMQRGFTKAIASVDTRDAQRLGLLRPLVRKEIEKHYADFGLEAEFVSHNTMRGLSGGQKVKVVLGAATWRRPHIVILDEPSNFIDRESLAALIEGLKDFGGGVLLITHSSDVSTGVCSEVWAMRDGKLEASGHNWVQGQGSGERIDKKTGEEEEEFDAMGNKIAKSGKKKVLSSSEARKAKKDRIARRKRGEEVFTDEEL